MRVYSFEGEHVGDCTTMYPVDGIIKVLRLTDAERAKPTERVTRYESYHVSDTPHVTLGPGQAPDYLPGWVPSR